MSETRHSTNRRLAGILVPVFSIRGENDLGIGDVSSLKEFVRFAAETGFGFVQVLPINETGPDNSPYNAISSVAIEPMTLDCTTDGLKDLSEEVFHQVTGNYDLAGLNAGSVQYETVRRLKYELLQRAYDGFLVNVQGQVDIRAEAFEAFCEAESAWLNDYCIFRFFMDRERGSQVWQQWDESYRTKEKALELLMEEAKVNGDQIDRDLRYYAYVQWIAFEQWKGISEYAGSKDISLMGDIPFGVSLYSCDVWANLDLFDLDWYGGAPPETLFKDDEFVQKWGQNWGIPLYRWDVHEESNFDWWRQRISKTTDIFGMLRVDHALGFYRIYSFPWNPIYNDEFLPLTQDEAAARCEGRVPGFRPRADHSDDSKKANRAEGEKYFRMILEAAGGSEVIAEDLGTVPDYVRPSLESLEIAGMKVPQWEFNDGHVASGLHYPSLSFAAYATHDHAPMRAQWEEAQEAMNAAEQESDEWCGHRNFLATLCSFAGIEMHGGDIPEFSPQIWECLFREICFSNSDRVAIMISDVLGETDRINIPGVMDGTNWSYRVPVSSHELAVGENFWDLREMLKKVLNEAGRSRRVGTF
ncbi:MAG: 4-alpha-glucanotransferase [Verrucomicrobiota bacterium]